MNNPVTIDQIPDYEEITFSDLHPNYAKIARMNAIVLTVIVVGLLLFTFFIFDEFEKYLIMGAIFLIHSFLVFYILKSYRYKKYAFRKHDALFKSGILFQATHIVPYVRLQHIVVEQGWYAKRLGLATLCLNTAAPSSTVAIPGLPLEDAERWKNFLLNQIQSIENEHNEL